MGPRRMYDGRMIAPWLLIGVGVGIAAPACAQISGRVVANGGPPPERAWVTVHCEGPATWDWAGYTDKRGEFLSSAADGRANFDGDFMTGSAKSPRPSLDSSAALPRRRTHAIPA